MIQIIAKLSLALALVACVASAAPLDDAPASPLSGFMGAMTDLSNKAKEAASSVTQSSKVPDASSINQEIKKQSENFGLGSFFNKFTDAVKNAQENSAKGMAEHQKSASDAVNAAQDSAKSLADPQKASQAAQSGQTSFAAAIGELGKSLQTFASTNPSLVPDVKKIYEKVSSKFSSSSSQNAPVAPASA